MDIVRNGINTCLRLPSEPSLLRNPDSLCYVTSVLEMLSLVRPFVKQLVGISHDESPILRN